MLGLCVSLTGCLTHTQRVDEKYPTDYKKNHVYVLQQDCALVERPSRGWLEELRLDLPKLAICPLWWNASPAKRVATLPAGTRVRYSRLIYWWYFESAEVLPIARVLDGPFAGNDVNVERISRGESFEQFFIDPDWLAATDARHQ
jgi:hypothetical protein